MTAHIDMKYTMTPTDNLKLPQNNDYMIQFGLFLAAICSSIPWSSIFFRANWSREVDTSSLCLMLVMTAPQASALPVWALAH